jgi:hypothetical protein
MALFHQLRYKEATDTGRLFAYCLRQSGHSDHLIRKALLPAQCLFVQLLRLRVTPARAEHEGEVTAQIEVLEVVVAQRFAPGVAQFLSQGRGHGEGAALPEVAHVVDIEPPTWPTLARAKRPISRMMRPSTSFSWSVASYGLSASIISLLYRRLAWTGSDAKKAQSCSSRTATVERSLSWRIETFQVAATGSG